MRNRTLTFIAALVLGTMALVGCGDSGTATKEQQDAIINKTGADPNYKGPSQEDKDKMAKAISDYNEKHKNDKVEFKNN